MMLKVFAYGTLMRNCYNHHYLTGHEYLGQARLKGFSIYNLGGFPGIIPDKTGTVLGELYEIDLQTLERVDRLEDNGGLYSRQTIEVWLDENMISAQIYVWNGRVIPENKIAFDMQPWSDAMIRRCS